MNYQPNFDGPPPAMRRLAPQVANAFARRRLTAHLRRRPDFVIIGGMRCGTTTFYARLSRHSMVAPAIRKEIHYFDYPTNFRQGWDWYMAHFPLQRDWTLTGRARKKHFLTGECSPYYCFHPLARDRLKHALPNAKIIFIIRDPAARALSQHGHETRLGYESMSFEDALDAEAERLAGEADRLRADPNYYSYAHQHYSYQTRGLYADQIRFWREAFAAEQMLVIELERLLATPRAAFADVFRFLEIPDENLRLKHRAQQSSLTNAQRERLHSHFALPNEDLADLLGRKLAWS